MDEIAIKIEHVSKEYRLGAIGGGTLRGDLQSWMARLKGKKTPTARSAPTQQRTWVRNSLHWTMYPSR